VHLSRRHRRRLVAKYRKGTEVVELSTEFGITVGQVRGLLEEAGEELPPGDRDRGGLIDVFAPTN
jgi:DNA-directed RNA polymerase specialized sigma24 family protein